jgi:uncharacterized glyoxalase superfamily protein PhnB
MPRQLMRSAPYFPVADVGTSADHYATVLGFKTDYAAGNEFAIVSRDGLSIMLRHVADASKIVPNEAQGGTWDVFFWIADAQSLHDELQANGATIVYGPIVQTTYGMKEFAVRDHDGYVLGFGQNWPEGA